MKCIRALFLLFLGLPLFAFAQDDTATSRLFRIGFQSSIIPVTDNTMTDSTGLRLYIAPQFSYTHPSGFGIILRTYFLTGQTSSGNFLSTLTPNFEKNNNKLYAAVNYTHFFYTSNTAVPYTPIKNELYGNIRLKTKIIQPLLTLNLGWGKDSAASTVSDVNILAGFAHEFNIKTGSNSSMSLLPAIILNGGTNHYFSLLKGSPYIGHSKNYNAIVHGQNHARGRGNTGSGTITGSSTATKNAFALSQLEANLYIYYSIGKITIEPDASVFFPLHSGEVISSYFQLTANFNF